MFYYGMKYRPFGIGCQPRGFVNVIEAQKNIDGYYSIVVYERELTETEIYGYELIKVEGAE